MEPSFLLYLTGGYIISHYGFQASLWQKYISQKNAVYVQLYGSGLFLLLLSLLGIPLFFKSSLSDFGLSFNHFPLSLTAAIGLMTLLGPLLFKASKQEAQQALYPMIRDPHWSKQTMLTYLCAWAVYLLGYELFFRGLVLFGLIHFHGVTTGIYLMVTLYVLVHLPKSAGETMGCIPLGLLWGYLTVITGSVLHVVIVHVFIACASQYFGFRHHPAMDWED